MAVPAVALVGLGRWGFNHARTIRETGTLRLAAVCDLDRAKREAVDVPGAASLERLLELPGLDAAIIATPNPTHYELTRRCLEAGLDVLAEKPLALDSRSALALVTLAEERGRLLATTFPALYLPGYDRCRDAVDSGTLGAVVSASSTRTSSGCLDPDADVLWDLAPHDIAIAASLFGSPRTTRLERSDGRAVFELGFPAGFALSGTVAWRDTAVERCFSVSGTRGRARITEQHGAAPADRPLARLLADFAAAVRTRKQPRCSARLGLEVVRCLESLETLDRVSAPVPARHSVPDTRHSLLTTRNPSLP
ncbi:Gfo/Idh/MocA family oxidoreductase [candidate division WOR-3 bacterium]|nr:Gfo/Idh/MocA family oxidoreductase [candidate division WOR-3 bacterium]